VWGSWSPDSQWIVTTADPEGQRPGDFLLIHVPSGRLFTLRIPVVAVQPFWSLDGRTLVASPLTTFDEETQKPVPGPDLYVIELPDLAALVQDVAPTGK
jgi:hypothetical protein